ncbi:hypothetical protein L6R52_27675, partial [Myxococcota bacterium]|nr:hypothetical protein [Myxococcota bacterium]
MMTLRDTLGITSLVALVALGGAGCTEKAASLIGLRNAGESCVQVSDCKAGFVCSDEKICVAIQQTDTSGRPGSTCTTSSDCRVGACCGSQGVCREDRADFEEGHCGYLEGDLCGMSSDCDVGLVCNGLGECAAPGGPGQAQRGEECSDFSDCMRPLICGIGTCEPPPFYAGVSCVRSEEELGAFRVYFELPRAGVPLDEFYRQPFPSDVRRVDGRLDLAGHPSPGAVAGVDFTRLYLDAIAADSDGFGLSQPVILQLSDLADRRTITSSTADPTIRLVNIDPMSPEQGDEVPIQLSYEEERGLFTCTNALAVAPIDGIALRPNTTYALLVDARVTSIRGEAPIHDGDFAKVMADARPIGDDDAARAWDAWKPLRDWLLARGERAEDYAVGVVYTTGDPAATAPLVRAAVRAAPAPELRA